MKLSELGKGVLITGPAGAGKTYALIENLKSILNMNAFEVHQVFPAISAMHGARRRLLGRLTGLKNELSSDDVQFNFTVETIDSFALSITNRYRLSIGVSKLLCPCDVNSAIETETSLRIPVGSICTYALNVIRHQHVKNNIRRTYPAIVIDEFQDCRDDKLEFIKELSDIVTIICAADGFQCIDGTNDSPAVEWGLSNLSVNELPPISKRTSEQTIISSACRLRGIPTDSDKRVKKIDAPSGPVAASTIMTYERARFRYGSSVILSYSSNKFVKDTLDWLLKGKPTKPGKEPLPFRRQISEKDELNLIRDEYSELFSNITLPLDEKIPDDIFLIKAWEKLVSRARCSGKTEVQVEELWHEVAGAIHYHRSYSNSSTRRVSMPIHSAKNQEWDNVYILWSDRHFRAKHDEEFKKRILYNAITRAKRNCLILCNAVNEADPVNGI